MKIAIVIILAALEATAFSDSTPTPEDLYNEGQVAYDSADYKTAIAKWQASYELSGESDLLFNLAQAYRLSGDCASALKTYKQFTTADPMADPHTTDQHTLAKDLARELEPVCGSRSTTPSVAQTVPITRPINAAHESTRPGRGLRIAGLVTGGAGITSLAVGLVIGRRAALLGSEITLACATSCDWSVEKSKDAKGRRDALIGYTLDTIGIATLVGGAALYYLGNHAETISIAPQAREGGAIVSYRGAW